MAVHVDGRTVLAGRPTKCGRVFLSDYSATSYGVFRHRSSDQNLRKLFLYNMLRQLQPGLENRRDDRIRALPNTLVLPAPGEQTSLKKLQNDEELRQFLSASVWMRNVGRRPPAAIKAPRSA